MSTLAELADEFLNQKHIAVAGVSRSGGAEAANAVYRKLRDGGYQVYAVNPNAAEVEGDPCYASLADVPQPVDGVVAATSPAVTEQIVKECAELGIPRVWIHRSLGQGSYSAAAVEYGRQHGVTVIPGGCPMMFCQPVDIAHKCIHWFLNLTGKLPKEVQT